VGFYFHESPWIGRGLSTFIPSIYRTLDNQYLGTLIESGLLGLIALLALLVGSVSIGLSIRARSSDPEVRSLSYSLAVSAAVAVVSFFTFDAFGFPMLSGMLFLLLGCLGALWRLEIGNRQPERVLIKREHARPVVVVCAVVVAGLFLSGVMLVRSAAPEFRAQARLPLYGPPNAGGNKLQGGPSPDNMAQLLQLAATGPETRSRLAALGITHYEVAIGSGSLATDTDLMGLGNTLVVGATGSSAEQAVQRTRAVALEINSELASWQQEAEVPQGNTITVSRTELPSSAEMVTPSRSRAELALLVLAIALFAGVKRVFTQRCVIASVANGNQTSRG
jgi:hypothetical protein